MLKGKVTRKHLNTVDTSDWRWIRYRIYDAEDIRYRSMSAYADSEYSVAKHLARVFTEDTVAISKDFVKTHNLQVLDTNIGCRYFENTYITSVGGQKVTPEMKEQIRKDLISAWEAKFKGDELEQLLHLEVLDMVLNRNFNHTRKNRKEV